MMMLKVFNKISMNFATFKIENTSVIYLPNIQLKKKKFSLKKKTLERVLTSVLFFHSCDVAQVAIISQ
jgi:hypothetical protein